MATHETYEQQRPFGKLRGLATNLQVDRLLPFFTRRTPSGLVKAVAIDTVAEPAQGRMTPAERNAAIGLLHPLYGHAVAGLAGRSANVRLSRDDIGEQAFALFKSLTNDGRNAATIQLRSLVGDIVETKLGDESTLIGQAQMVAAYVSRFDEALCRDLEAFAILGALQEVNAGRPETAEVAPLPRMLPIPVGRHDSGLDNNPMINVAQGGIIPAAFTL